MLTFEFDAQRFDFARAVIEDVNLKGRFVANPTYYVLNSQDSQIINPKPPAGFGTFLGSATGSCDSAQYGAMAAQSASSTETRN